MLPAHLLSLTLHDDHATPSYLTERDEPWARAVVDLCESYIGRPVGEREESFVPRVRAIAAEHGVAQRVADGMANTLARKQRSTIASAKPPATIRDVVFRESARDPVFYRDAVLARAAAILELTSYEVERGLFADRANARMILNPLKPLSAKTAVEAYNLSLVQGLLLRSEVVTVDLREHVRAVVRFAKLSGLLCTFALGARGTRVEVSGPLTILRHTTKYGYALANFFPAVLGTTGYRLEARCLIGAAAEPLHVRIDASDRIARTHVLPRDTDSKVEEALVRDVRALDRGWLLIREADAIQVGNRLFFPDFRLERGGRRILVEVVGFYTPEYLRSKLEALRAVEGHELIVCIDESLACDTGDIPGHVLRFKRRVDARALLDTAEGVPQ